MCTVEDQLELHAVNLLERKENLMERYRNLIYADSIKPHPLSETVMLERTFISSERELLKEERYIAQYAPGKSHDELTYIDLFKHLWMS